MWNGIDLVLLWALNITRHQSWTLYIYQVPCLPVGMVDFEHLSESLLINIKNIK